jgi:hypothetical protein
VDKFTKYALITMTVIVVAMLVSTYVGYIMFGPSIFETRYLTVIEDQAMKFGRSFGWVVQLGVTGEYIGFTLAGVVAGLVIGYLIPTVFENEGEKK